MLDGLARFVYRRRGWVAIGAVVFFLGAGAIGGSVANHLDPYGADDPATTEAGGGHPDGYGSTLG